MTTAPKYTRRAEDGIYLLSHSVGRPPVSVENAWQSDFLQVWQDGSAEPWPAWLDKIEGFNSALATLLNGRTTDFCPQTNLSSAFTKILYSLPPAGNKNVIVMTELDFPSMGFVISQATRAGFQLRVIPRHIDTLNAESWREFLGADVHSVLITHVYSNTGGKVAVADIVKLADRHDIVSVVDVAQSVGIVPIDVQQWNASFVVGSCVKWLCGGPGAGFLWANPDIVQRCEPLDVGWFSHENPFEFDYDNFRYANDASRFWGGTPSVIPYIVAANSIRLAIDIGIENIRKHNIELCELLLQAIDPGASISPLHANQRGGTLVLNFGQRQDAVASKLSELGVRFDLRAAGMRLSPHIYTTQQDIETCLTAIAPG